MSARPRFEVADVFRVELNSLACGASLLPVQRRIMRAIESCRTAALGGHVEACDACATVATLHNSCANRHCPAPVARARPVVEARSADLLPTHYFHVVFTLPEEIAHLAPPEQARRLRHPLCRHRRDPHLDRLGSQTPRRTHRPARRPAHLGTDPHPPPPSALHRPGRRTLCRPLALDPLPKALLPSRKVLSWRFRHLFDMLTAAFPSRRPSHFTVSFASGRSGPSSPASSHVSRISRVVYAKRTFGSPERVLKYPGRYTHRVAISNHRITDISDSHVSFSLEGLQRSRPEKIMTITVDEFIRRFLLHVLPSGFHRIRSTAFANSCRAANSTHLSSASGVTVLPTNRLEHC
ncbi:MAG: transposase [Blastocatellia bacterium]|nr:transposase [Blastocatellia bacterium]